MNRQVTTWLRGHGGGKCVRKMSSFEARITRFLAGKVAAGLVTRPGRDVSAAGPADLHCAALAADREDAQGRGQAHAVRRPMFRVPGSGASMSGTNRALKGERHVDANLGPGKAFGACRDNLGNGTSHSAC
jgi:hypothetical protein